MNLVTTKRNLENQISLLNGKAAEDRNAAVSAIEQLVQTYVVPAMKIGSLNEDSIYTFNLDEIAGTEIHNLMLSLFESKLSGLEKPDDAKLEESLTAIGIRDLSETKRNDFYTVWAGEKAIESIAYLTKFLLNDRDISQNTDRLKTEHERILRLLNNDLPEDVESQLKTLLSSADTITT